MGKFDKAKRKTTAKPKKKWWIINTKRYSYYIWALPFIPFIELSDKIKDRKYRRLRWDTRTATKVLDIILPQILEWVEEDKAFYYSMEWNFHGYTKFVPRRLRKWVLKYRYDLHQYVKNGYENADYIKTIEKDNYDEIWVKFVEKY